MWTAISGILNHGFAGRWRLGGLLPAVNEDEAVTKGQLDAVGGGFPFVGDATIDGTLNIDFTDTLDFVMDEVDYPNNPHIGARIQGDFAGTTYREGDLFGYIGHLDGILNVGAGMFELPAKQWVAQFIDEDSEVFIGVDYGFLDTTGIGGEPSIVARPIGLSSGDDYFTVFAGAGLGGDWIFEITKEAGGGIVGNTSLTMGSGTVGFEVTTGVDDGDSYFIFRDNNDDELLGLRGNSITSANLASKDFADDAAAEAGNVLLNGLYHTSGVVKIRLT